MVLTEKWCMWVVLQKVDYGDLSGNGRIWELKFTIEGMHECRGSDLFEACSVGLLLFD